MELQCKKTECTGCMACYNICPVNAITIERERGFFVPNIKPEVCINCGKCNKVCPQIIPAEKHNPLYNNVYAVFNKEKKVRDSSSSGGVFYSLAKEVIDKGGIVYGAVWDETFLVKIIRGKNMEDVHRMQGSKYVQSLTGDIYKFAEEDLNNGLTVLFTGLGCQIAGLLKYLGREYDNLITCEVLCHGGSSPVILQEHIIYTGRKQGTQVVSVNFRHKTEKRCQNIKYEFQNGTSITLENPMEDLYYSGFQSGKLLRESCFQCSYVGTQRCADITIADFWRVKKEAVRYPDKMSYPSLLMINTLKGEVLWEKVSDNFERYMRPMQEAVEGNLAFRRSVPRSMWRDRFFKEYEKDGYERAAIHCLAEHFNIKEWTKKVIGPKATGIMLKVLRR